MPLEPHVPARGELPDRPVAHVEAAEPERLDPCLEAREEAVEQEDRVDRASPGGGPEARHRRREVGREAVGGPVRVEPDPHDDARGGGPEPVGFAQDAAELADGTAPGAGARILRRSSSITRSFGHLRRMAWSRRPAASSAASAIARLTVAARRQACPGTSHVGRKPSERSSAPPGGASPGPAHPPAARGLLVGERQADLRGARVQPRADHVLGRGDPGEALLPGEEWCHGRPVSRPVPASPRRPSSASGTSSSNAAWSAGWRRSRAGPPRWCR